MKNPSPEELERMAEARQASLIRKWLTGRKLAPDEKNEIAHLLPPHLLAQGPSAPGAQAAVNGALSTRKHAKFEHKLLYYEPIYASDNRTLKRWIKRGKEIGRIPPFDAPGRMAGWWRSAFEHQVPDKLLAFETPAPPAAFSDARADEPGASEGEPAIAPRDFSGVRGLDLGENVEALRRTHAINKHLLDEALAGTNENMTTLRQKNFERSFELLRKAEQSLVDLQKQRGNLIDREAVRTELAQFCESLRLMRESMPRRVIVGLEGLLPRRFQRILGRLEVFLIPAIEKARASEDEIFRQLETLDGPETVQKLLAA